MFVSPLYPQCVLGAPEIRPGLMSWEVSPFGEVFPAELGSACLQFPTPHSDACLTTPSCPHEDFMPRAT